MGLRKNSGVLLASLLALLIASCAGQADQQESTDGVVVGADRLMNEYIDLLDGKKVAITTNHSGKLSDGRHIADVIHELPNSRIVSLLGMNYNIRSNDYSLPHEPMGVIDELTGAPKYSLYGEIHKPTVEMLHGADVVVFDIQEVGARFYEHINILGFVMETAAETGAHVIVLDRPNPITGLKVDGFITDDEFMYSFGAFGKVPVIHGMTMGELARFYNGEQQLRGGAQAELTVIEMKNWERSMWMDETGIPWEKPSPNLPTLTSTLVYTGTCLFEGLNLSEGRGTEKPFEFIGAPWLNHSAVVQDLNELGLAGVQFEVITFTPQKMPFHSRDPYLAGIENNGIFANVTDRDLFEPYKVGVAMVWAVNKHHSEELEWNESAMLRLTSTRRLMDMIKNGDHPSQIYESWAQELNEFMPVRENYMLY